MHVCVSHHIAVMKRQLDRAAATGTFGSEEEEKIEMRSSEEGCVKHAVREGSGQ
jgi:hypothetical protein